MLSPTSETVTSSKVAESIGSNPESPSSPLKNETKGMIHPGHDVDFSSKAYANELLECGLKEERFRIDRKKLEDMLQAQQSTNSTIENAEVFFQRVMLETSTLISWPSKLKIGAKSKKDPHVKIVGKPEAVQFAKEKILEILDTKKNRVTLKMDVSHSDHSYIIGKGGFKIQQVMEETGCHIHFPDSNRNNSAEKSNQVSIAGQAAGVELARSKIRKLIETRLIRQMVSDTLDSRLNWVALPGRPNGTLHLYELLHELILASQQAMNGFTLRLATIRMNGNISTKIGSKDLLPLVFMFELPNGETVNPGAEYSPDIQHIQQTYSFNVAFRWSVGHLGVGRTVLVVRGCQRLLSRLRQGLSLLMEYLTGSKTIPMMGFMKTEIAAQHHQFVMGACNVNTQMVMNKTGATIIFPDTSTFCSESSTQTGPLIAGDNIVTSKSTVIIQGSFDSVCLAWQELLKCLPLVLMFDLKEGQELDPVMVNNFMESFNINIMVRPKIKENTKSVLIRGAEKDCNVLFQVRKEILGLDEDDTGPISSSKTSYRTSNFGKIQIPRIEVNDQMQRPAQNMSTAESINLLTNIIQQNPQIVGILSNLSSAFSATNSSDVLPVQNPTYRAAAQNPVQQIQMNHYTAKREVENWINRQDRGYTLQSGTNFQNYLQKDCGFSTDDGDSGIFMPSRNKFQSCFETRSDMSSQPESSASSTSSNETPDFKTNTFLKKISQSNESKMGADINQLMAEYGNKKIIASKVMQQPIGEGARTPTQMWSGYGFSKSMPDFAERAKRAAQNSGSISEFLDMDSSKTQGVGTAKTWTSDLLEKSDSPVDQVTSPFNFSNFWESVPQQPSINYGAIKSVDQLLSLLDLEKYTEVLNHHEIDLMTFITLSDIDLQQLGVSYGARRKMLAAISAIRDHRLGDNSLKNFRAAPGAERRSFLTRYASGSPLHEENGGRI